jgi:hypothetical protein
MLKISNNIFQYSFEFPFDVRTYFETIFSFLMILIFYLDLTTDDLSPILSIYWDIWLTSYFLPESMLKISNNIFQHSFELPCDRRTYFETIFSFLMILIFYLDLTTDDLFPILSIYWYIWLTSYFYQKVC